MPDDNPNIYDDIEVIDLGTTEFSIDEIVAENNDINYTASDFGIDASNVGISSITPIFLNRLDNANSNYLLTYQQLELKLVGENQAKFSNLIGDVQNELNSRITAYDDIFMRTNNPEARKIIIKTQNNARMAVTMTNELKNANWNDANAIKKISSTYRGIMDPDSEINRTVDIINKKTGSNPFNNLSRTKKALRCMSKFLNGLLKAINYVDTIDYVCKAIGYYWDGDKKKGNAELEKAIKSGMWNLAGSIGIAIVALTECLVLVIGFIILLVAVDYILCDDEEGILERFFNRLSEKAAEVSEPWFDKVIHEVTGGLFGTRGWSPQNIFGF